jgi:uncharacterized membrane protein YccC
MALSDQQRQAATATGLRAATAATICFVVVEWLHLDNGYLSLVSAVLVNLNYSNTPFQKSLERIVGRLLGVGFCTVLVVFLHDAPFLILVLCAALLLPAWYVQSSGRFAYGALLLGVFLAMTLSTSLIGGPAAAVTLLQSNLVQIVLGVGVAELLNFATGAEQTVALQPGGQPLLPLRGDWLNRSLMLTTLSLATPFLILLSGLPVLTTTTSTIVLGAAPDPRALRTKGLLRAAAPVLAGVYCVVILLIVARLPSFALLLTFVFLGLLVACYLAQTTLGYAGLQMGIVLPMTLVVPATEVANLGTAVQRLIGIIVGFGVALLFQLLWPGFARQTAPAHQ